MKAAIFLFAAALHTSIASAQSSGDLCTSVWRAQMIAVVLAYQQTEERSMRESVREMLLEVVAPGAWESAVTTILIDQAKKAVKQNNPSNMQEASVLANKVGRAEGTKCKEVSPGIEKSNPDTSKEDNALAIKGYSVGQRYATCPAGSKQERPNQTKSVVTCEFGSTSYGGANAKNFTLFLFEGKVLGAFVEFGFGGKNNHFTLRDALTQKYGTPSDNQKAINAYTWRQGTVSLTLNGLEGHVTLTDQTAFDRAKKLSAEEAQKDL